MAMICQVGQAAGTGISNRALADSLNRYAGFPTCVPRVRVRNVRINNDAVSIQTNKTLSCLSLTPSELTGLRRKVSLWTLGHTNGKISIYSDGSELKDLITSRFESSKISPERNQPGQMMVEQEDRLWEGKKGLDGHHIALWPSHGMYYNHAQQIWRWQRATMWTIVEDLFTDEIVEHWLVPMLENSGAYILQPRERDTQTHEIILSGETQEETKGKRFTPKVTHPGEYGLYVRYRADKNSDTHLTVCHRGVRTAYTIRTDMGAGVWQWIGRFDLSNSPDSNYIETDNQNITAIRLGGGMGSIAREGQTSGLPRWAEAARYWLEYVGYPDSIWSNNTADDYRDDLQCRGYWVNYISGGSRVNSKHDGLGIPVSLSLALHTDGYSAETDTSIIGTLSIYSGRKNRDVADFVQTQLTHDVRALYTQEWTRRELNDAAYAEARYPDITCMLLEMLSHKNFADIQYGIQPQFQQDISRAIYKGIGRYLNEKFVPQPLAVSKMRLSTSHEEEGDRLHVEWQAVEDPLEESAHPTYFIVYTRVKGMDWDNGTKTQNTYLDIEMERGVLYDVRVVAGNEGGISLPSETLSAYLAPADQENGKILIVNDFHQTRGPRWFCDSTYAGIIPTSYSVPHQMTRSYIGQQFVFDKRLDWVDDDNCGWGMCYQDYRGKLMVGNTFDYPHQHGVVLRELGYSFVSCDRTALDSIGNEVSMIDWICGKEDNVQLPLDEIRRFLTRGGRILVSGEKVSSSLAKHDKKQMSDVLHISHRAPLATRNGRISMSNILNPTHSTYTLATEPNEQRLLTDEAEAILPCSGAKSIGTYEDSGLHAGAAWEGNGSKVMMLAFPLESANDFDNIYTDCINWLSK